MGLDPKLRVKLRELPRWEGLDIRERTLSAADVNEGRFLVLQQTLPGTERVYELVIEDICADLATVNDSAQALEATARALGRWEAFFQEHGLDGLSSQAERGLFGELWLLREKLAAKVGQQLAHSSWTGYSRTNHDFQLESSALEVKTTTGRQPHEVRITSERQLDNQGLNHLFLFVLVLGELQSGGVTLPRLVAQIRSDLDAEPMTKAELERKLIRVGYLDAHRDRYSTGYVVRAVRCYSVESGFPRILESDLTEGIGDVAYTLSLAACAAFVRDTDEALNTVSQGINQA